MAAGLWYFVQMLLEHYGINRKLCLSIDKLLKRLAKKILRRSKNTPYDRNEYFEDITDGIDEGKSIFEKMMIFLGSFWPKKPPPNIPDLKKSGEKIKPDEEKTTE